MVFTEACLKETLRKYTVVPVITRVAMAEVALCGHNIPKGSKIVLHLQGTHCQWKDPEQYRPERFLPGGEYDSFPESIRRCSHFQSFPVWLCFSVVPALAILASKKSLKLSEAVHKSLISLLSSVCTCLLLPSQYFLEFYVHELLLHYFPQ
jgi:hypothetical protein